MINSWECAAGMHLKKSLLKLTIIGMHVLRRRGDCTLQRLVSSARVAARSRGLSEQLLHE